MNEFFKLIEDALEKEPGSVKPTDKYKEFDEWDSLALLSLIASINEEYDITISRFDLDKLSTVQELHDFIQRNK